MFTECSETAGIVAIALPCWARIVVLTVRRPECGRAKRGIDHGTKLVRSSLVRDVEARQLATAYTCTCRGIELPHYLRLFVSRSDLRFCLPPTCVEG